MSTAETTVRKDLEFFADPSLDRTVALIFELAAQLHVERQRLAALEQILIDKNVVTHGGLDHLASDQDFAEASRDGLNRSLRQMMRIIVERGGPTGPLRDETLASD